MCLRRSQARIAASAQLPEIADPPDATQLEQPARIRVPRDGAQREVDRLAFGPQAVQTHDARDEPVVEDHVRSAHHSKNTYGYTLRCMAPGRNLRDTRPRNPISARACQPWIQESESLVRSGQLRPGRSTRGSGQFNRVRTYRREWKSTS